MPKPTARSASSLPQPVSRREKRTTLLIVALLILVTGGSLAAVVNYVAAEKERTLQAWQIRLGLVADSRRAALDDWLARQRHVLEAIAGNESVRLYLSERQRLLAAGETAEAAAMLDFVRNLMSAKALEAGFDPALPALPANIRKQQPFGIALLDRNGQTISASPDFAGLPPAVRRHINGSPYAEAGFVDFTVLAENAQPGLGFFVPVFGHQQAPGEDSVVARIVGLKAPDQSFFAALTQPGDGDGAFGETFLVRDEGKFVRYLDVHLRGEAALQRTLSADMSAYAAVALNRQPGRFGSYRAIDGSTILATSRQLFEAPWTVVRKIDAEKALAASERRLFVLASGCLLVIALVSIGAVALWRHGASIRTAKAALALRNSVQELNRLSHFLRHVTDSQPTCILALDEDGKVTFANERLLEAFDMRQEDVIGKSLKAILGPDQARELALLNDAAMVTGEQRHATLELQSPAGGARLWKSTHVPISGSAPDTGDMPANGQTKSAVLMVLDDITMIVESQQRQENTLRQLITTVLKVVDRRDPYSANHSERVAEVAKVLAAEMQLPQQDVDTAEIAGALMNLGKIFVPSALLTKEEALTEEEKEQVQASILVSADLLQHIDFPGPVVETLQQVHERWDGHGIPDGKMAEDILAPARVVAVANSFVAMASARAYRPGTPIGDAVRQLAEDMDRRYDPRAIAALMNFVSNKGGFRRWQHFNDLSKDASQQEATEGDAQRA